MLATSIICLGTGLPTVALGWYLQQQPARPAGGGKRKGKKAAAKGARANPGSFLLGGLVVTLAGVAFLVGHFAR